MLLTVLKLSKLQAFDKVWMVVKFHDEFYKTKSSIKIQLIFCMSLDIFDIAYFKHALFDPFFFLFIVTSIKTIFSTSVQPKLQE